MCSWKSLIAVFWIGLVSSLAEATPPPQVERDPPHKEPVYQQTPYYCLLVIGPEAKRYWLVLDGETVYLDRNGNGDLTDNEDRITAAPAIRLINPALSVLLGNVSYAALVPKRVPALQDRALSVSLGALRGAAGQAPFSSLFFLRWPFKDPKDIRFWICTDDPRVLPKPRQRSGIGVGITIGTDPFPPKPQEAPQDIRRKVAEGVLARRPQEAPILWLDGPLAMNLVLPEETFLIRGEKAAHLYVTVGTFVSENGSRVLTLEDIPSRLHPVADIEFPAQGGGKPIRARFVLEDRC